MGLKGIGRSVDIPFDRMELNLLRLRQQGATMVRESQIRLLSLCERLPSAFDVQVADFLIEFGPQAVSDDERKLARRAAEELRRRHPELHANRVLGENATQRDDHGALAFPEYRVFYIMVFGCNPDTAEPTEDEDE